MSWLRLVRGSHFRKIRQIGCGRGSSVRGHQLHSYSSHSYLLAHCNAPLPGRQRGLMRRIGSFRRVSLDRNHEWAEVSRGQGGGGGGGGGGAAVE